ncbi:MAG TPA: hypothetical protein VNY05_28470 [Candidatus Acidoferrales bacterium]|jgi:hypothetical protein|nr:hypothetical protein [Candidatus Acidoferrales bacterium]
MKTLLVCSLTSFTLLAGLLPASAQETTLNLSISATDTAAAVSASFAAQASPSFAGNASGASLSISIGGALSAPGDEIGAIPPPGFYPGDLSNPLNHPTVVSAQQHDIYLNCAPTCWGTPANFLADLDESDFIHITDQYVGTSANHRYTLGGAGSFTGTVPHILPLTTLVAMAHTAAAVYGTGLNHIYHFYLPPGQDICLNPTSCYSPDNFSTFVFCAFHSFINFGSFGQVLLTVEPFQNVPGCTVQAPSPNGLLIDSTATFLSHELFETITDPLLNAWFNRVSLDLRGAEIGDECQNRTFGYGSVSINHKKYEVQPEYSNAVHGCAFSPSLRPDEGDGGGN